VLWQRYDVRVRLCLATVQPGQFFNFQWPVYQDYFTVYTENASLLGRVADAELRTDIVRCYTFAKGIVDSLKLNADLVAEIDQIGLQGTPISGPLAERRQFLHAMAIAYVQEIKKSDVELEQTVASLLPRLERAIEELR
jgi:hypothetical protein